jgi:outer membrane protein assembly factor BamB
MGVRASDGKLLWTYDIEATTAVIPSPIVRDDLVFFVAGYKRGGALLRQVVDDARGIKVEELYPLIPELANKHGGVVLVGDYLYGDSDDRGIPYCAELMTGKVLWKERGSGQGSASIAAADGHLYIRYADGTMTLVKASRDSLQEVGKFKVSGSGERPSWAHPVILDGRLYLREGDKILCYQLKDEAKG